MKRFISLMVLILSIVSMNAQKMTNLSEAAMKKSPSAEMKVNLNEKKSVESFVLNEQTPQNSQVQKANAIRTKQPLQLQENTSVETIQQVVSFTEKSLESFDKVSKTSSRFLQTAIGNKTDRQSMLMGQSAKRFDAGKSAQKLPGKSSPALFEDGFEASTGDGEPCVDGQLCEVGDIPADWTQVLGISADPEDKWLTLGTTELSDNPALGSWPLTPNTGDRFAMIKAGEWQNATLDAWLISPDITLETGKTYRIRFYVEMPGNDYYSEYDMLEVYIGQGKTIAAMEAGQMVKKIDDEYIQVFTLVSATFTATADGAFNIGFRAITPHMGAYGTGFYILLDDVSVAELIGADAELAEIITPQSGVNLTNAEKVKVTIKNNGATNLTSVDLEVFLDNTSKGTETWTGNLAPGASEDYELTTVTLDLTADAAQTFGVKVVATVADDNDNTNDFKVKSVVNTFIAPFSVPQTWNFENTTNAARMPANWYSDHAMGSSLSANAWGTAAGAQIQSGVIVNSGSRSMFIINTAGVDAMLITSVEVEQGKTYRLSFRGSLFKADNTTADYEHFKIYTGPDYRNNFATGTEIFAFDPTTMGAAMSTAWHDYETNMFTASESGTYYIGFHSNNPADIGWWTSIDDVVIEEVLENDLAISDAIFPFSQFPSAQGFVPSLTATVSNLGYNTQTNVKVEVKLNDVVIGTSDPISLDGDESQVVTIPLSGTPAFGQNTVTYAVSSDFTDENPGNNTAESSFAISANTFSTSNEGIAYGIGGNANQTWGIMFTLTKETTIENVVSRVNTSGTQNYTLSIWPITATNTTDASPVHTQSVSTTGAQVWATWDIADLTLPAGDYYIGLTSTASITYLGDNSTFRRSTFRKIGNDLTLGTVNMNLRINVDFLNNDLGISATPFASKIPADQAAAMTLPVLRPTITNWGLQPQTDVWISALLDESTLGNTQAEPIASIAAGATIAGELTPMPNTMPTTVGTHTLSYTVTQAESDEVMSNNTTSITFEITDNLYAIDNAPAVVSGTGSTANGARFGNIFTITAPVILDSVMLANSSGGNSYSIAIYPMTDATTIGAAIATTTGLTSVAGWRTVAMTGTPVLSPGNYYLAYIQGSTVNPGIGFGDIMNGTTAYSAGTSGTTVTAMSTGPLAIRMITRIPPQNDVQVASITSPTSGVNLSAAEQVTITIRNFGTNSLTSVDLELFLDDVSIGTETWTGDLAMGETDEFTFQNYTLDLSGEDSYEVKVVATLADDADLDNNTKVKTVVNTVVAVAQIPYFEGFETTTDTDLPANWTKIGTGWITTNEEYGEVPKTGDRMLFKDYTTGGNIWAFSNPFELEQGTTYTVGFWFAAPGYSQYSEIDAFQVKIGQTPTSEGMATAQTVFANTNQVYYNWTYVFKNITASETGSYYLGIQNLTATGSGMYIVIDDISITETNANDLEILADALLPYAQIPLSQQVFPAAFTAKARNIGYTTQNNVKLSVTMNGDLIGTATPVATLDPDATSATMSVFSGMTSVPLGDNAFVYTVSGDETNEGSSNTATFNVKGTEGLYAVDTLTTPAPMGLGFQASGGTFAHIFEITHETYMMGVNVLFSQEEPASEVPYSVGVFKMTNETTSSTTVLGSKSGTRTPGEVTINFDEPVYLEPGRYAVAITQPAHSDASRNILVSADGVGSFYMRNATTGVLTFYEGGSGYGALAVRMVIDDTYEPPFIDAGVVSVTSPVSGELTDDEEVVVVVKNFGNQDLTDLDVVMIFDGGTPVTKTVSTLDAGEETPVSFGSVDMAVEKTYHFKFYTSLAEDMNDENDTLSSNVISSSTAVVDVRVASISTPSANNRANAVPVTAVINNDGTQAADNVKVELLLDNALVATEYITTIALSGHVTHTFTEMLDLSTQAGERNIKVITTIEDDVDADNDTLTLKLTNNIDVNPTVFVTPATLLTNAGEETVTVTIRNNGTFRATNIPITLLVNSETPVTEYLDSLNAGASRNFTFVAKANLAELTTHNLAVYTNLTADQDRVNDTIKQSVTNTDGMPVPFFEGFEGTVSNEIPTGWTRAGASVPGANNPVAGAWTTGDASVSMAGLTRPPYAGTRMAIGFAWQTTAVNAWLFTPGIGMVAGKTYNVEFWYMIPSVNAGGTPVPPNSFSVKVGTEATAAGMEETPIFTIRENANAWKKVAVTYTPTTNGIYYFGFNDHSPAASPGAGFATLLDNVSITEAFENDLEIVSNFPYKQVPTSQINPSAQAKNIGTTEQTNVKLSATLNGTLIGESDPVASVALGETSDKLTVTSTAEITEGSKTMVMTVTGDLANQGTKNTATYTFTATENTFATDTLTGPAAEGVGFPAGGSFVTVYEITKQTTLSAVQILFSQRDTTPSYTVSVYAMPTATTVAATPLASKTQNRVPGSVVVDFAADEVVLVPGLYAIDITSTANVQICYDEHSEGGWYVRDGSSLSYQTGGQGFGSLGMRLIINDEVSVPIEVVSTTPENNVTGVALDAQVSVTFNQPVTIANAGEITISPDPGGVSASISGNDLVIAHNDFEMSMTYTVTVAPGAIADYDQAITWSFTAEEPQGDISDPYGLAVTVAQADATFTWKHGEYMPYNEGFEGTTGTDLPTGWKRTNNTVWVGTSSAIEGVVDQNNNPSNIPPRTGTRQLSRSWKQTGAFAWAFSDGIYLTTGNTYTVSFWYQAPGYPTYNEYDMFKVQIGTTTDRTGTGAGATMTGAATVFSNTNQSTESDWVNATYQFTATETGLHYLGFHDMTPEGEGLYIIIDDISITANSTLTMKNDVESFDVYLNGEKVANVTDMQYVFTDLADGSYTAGVRAIGADGRSRLITTTFVITATSSVEKIVDIFTIYPNPVEDVLFIKTEATVKYMEIYSIQGKLVKTIAGDNNAVSVSELPVGAYVIRILTDNGIAAQRFIKK